MRARWIVLALCMALSMPVCARGSADAAVEVLIEDAVESGTEENLYNEAKSGSFSEPVLEDIINRGFLRSHIDELKVLGYLDRSFSLNSSRGSSGGSTGSSSSSDRSSSDSESSDNGGLSGTGDAENKGDKTAEGNTAGDTTSADKDSEGKTSKTSKDKSSNDGNSKSTDGRTEKNESNPTDVADHGNASDLEDASNYNNDDVKTVDVEEEPTASVDGTATITDKDGNKHKARISQEWLHTIDSKKVNHADVAEATDDSNTVVTKDHKNMIAVIVILAAIGISLAGYMYAGYRRKKELEDDKSNI